MTFFELLRTADNTAREQKRIIAYKADGNGVKVCSKTLISLSELFANASIISMYADFSDYKAIIYKDFEPCIEVQSIYNDAESGKIQTALIRYCQRMSNYSDFCEMIQSKIDNNCFIKNTELKLFEIHGDTELLQKAKQAKENRSRAIEEEYKQEKMRQEAERRNEEEAERENFEKLIAEYEQKIINKKPFRNSEIETPEGKETSIVLYLCQKYDIKVPLKTQGWIKTGLYEISWRQAEVDTIKEEITYSYHGRNSKVFYEYLRSLEYAILDAHGKITDEEKVKAAKAAQDSEMEKVLYNSIPIIDFEEIKTYRDEFDLHVMIKQSEPLTISKESAEGIYTRLYKASGIKDYKMVKERTNAAMILYEEKSIISVENYSNGISCSCKALKDKNGKMVYLFKKNSNRGNFKAVEAIA